MAPRVNCKLLCDAVNVNRVVALAVKSTAHTGTVVGIKEGSVENTTSLVTTGHAAKAGGRAASVLVKCCDVEDAPLVSTAGHFAGKRV